ncbi:hypothetical protein [Sorangium sp. So ce1389]|uniref:hypothetical protein n=1 Tax=Sorangium sp. So ce1389 TaxID=3133336 RepID=UPI003F5D9358
MVKLDPSGDHLFSRGYTIGEPFSAAARDIAVDAAGNAFVLVAYPNAVDTDLTLMKFDPAINLLWGQALHGDHDKARGGLAVDSAGNVVAATEHASGLGTCPCDHRFHIEKRDPAGALLWQKLVSGPAPYEDGGGARDVAIDPEDNVIVAGYSMGDLDLGGGPIAAGTDFIVKLSPLGDYLWHRTAPSDAVATDAAGNVIALGRGSLARLDPAGSELWRSMFTGTLQEAKVATSPLDGTIAIVGTYSETVDLGAGPLSAAGQDGLVAIFRP